MIVFYYKIMGLNKDGNNDSWPYQWDYDKFPKYARTYATNQILNDTWPAYSLYGICNYFISFRWMLIIVWNPLIQLLSGLAPQDSENYTYLRYIIVSIIVRWKGN